jgi:D-glycero-alpha-D-manno-heptose-7-phosphate kinase
LIVTRTPTRCSFFGGGTDYPEYFLKNGGQVLGAAITQHCHVVLHKSGEIWKCFDVPTRSGLATSSAFTVGLLKATSRLPNETLARVAVEWERDKSGGNVGFQDQYLCSLGGMLNIHFSDQGVDVKRIEDTNGLDKNLMLFYTGMRGMGSYTVIEEQLTSMKANASIYKDIAALVEPGIQAIKKGAEFGRLLNETWQLKRRLTEHTSTPEIDSMYEKAVNAGATGGKLLGAGNGGFLLLYVEQDKQESVRKSLGLKQYPFEFDKEGSTIVYEG